MGDTRRARAEWIGAAQISVDCHRRLRGPYTGVGQLLRTLVPTISDLRADLIRRHDIEILSIAPELVDVVQPSRETLTSLAAPKERTRFYAPNRTRRLAHGVIELLNSWASETGELTIALDTLEHASPLDHEFVALLLRRAHRQRLKVVVGSGSDADDDLSPELTAALRTYAVRIDAPDWPSESTSGLSLWDLARRFVASDGTSDVTGELSAYDQLSPAARAELHDRRAAELEGSPDRTLRLGAILYHLEHGTDPADQAAYPLFEAISYCLEMGFYDDLIHLAMRARQIIDPQTRTQAYLSISTKLGSALAYTRRVAEAEAVNLELRGLLTDPVPVAGLHYTAAMLQTRMRDPQDRDHATARAHLKTAIALVSLLGKEGAFHQAFYRNGLALVEMHAGDPVQALELVDWGIAYLDENLTAGEHALHRSVLLHNRGQLHATLGDLDAAISDLDTVIRLDPNYAEYYFDRAGLHLRRGAHEAALADYDHAIELSPPFYEVHYNRGQLLVEMGRADEALAEFVYVLELEPDHLDARVNLLALMLERGDTEHGVEVADEGLRIHPDDPHLLTTRGLLAQEQGNLSLAWECFSGALAKQPTMAEALCNRAVLAFELDKPDVALADLTRTLEAHGDNPDALYNRGFVYQRTGRAELAIDDYTRALALPGADTEELVRRREECQAALSAC